MARADDVQARSSRLTQAAALGFSDSALRAETADMDPGALALAEARDPLGGVIAGLRLTQEAVDTPPTTPGRPGLMSAAYLTGPAARPFHFADGDALQSARDLDCLTDAVYYEARGETAAGQAAVAQVVLNRVRHPAFPKTVCGVVFQGVAGDGCQFSFACDGSMRHPLEIAAWRRAEGIAARALAGFVMPSVGNATHFHVIGLDPGWGPRLLRVAQIGLHVFYRFGGYAGAPSTFNGQPTRSGPDDAPPAALQVASADGHANGGQYILASTAVTGSGPAAPATTTASADPKPPAPTSAPAAVKTDPAPVKVEAGT